MALKKGRKIWVEVDLNGVGDTGTADWQKIGQQRGGSSSGSTDTADGTHKDDDGWARGVETRRSWTLSVDGTLDMSDPVWVFVRNKWKSGTKIWCRINAQAEGGLQEYGEGWITDNSYEYPENDVVSFSIEIQGDGPLKPVPA